MADVYLKFSCLLQDMRIGIDISCWLNQRGQGRYTRELVRALLKLDQANRYWLFLDAETARQCKDLPESDRATRVVVTTSQEAIRGASTSGRRAFHDLWAMVCAARHYRNQIDLFYFPSATTFFPLWRRAKIILTIHDAIPNKYPDLIFARRRNHLLWKLKLAYAMKRANAIVTVSDSAKRDIARAFRIKQDTVKVIQGAVSPLFRFLGNLSESRHVAAEYGIGPEERFVLYVGGFSPHKNIGMLIDALAALRETPGNNDLKLVLVGDWSSFQSHYLLLQTQAAGLGLTGKVVFTSFVCDSRLLHLYNAADILVTASIDEGFGLPPLEAMACGTPVVASRRGALPEIIGEAGRYFDPSIKAELPTRLQEVLHDQHLRKEMRSQGLLRSRRFSWERSALTALALFEQLSSKPKS